MGVGVGGTVRRGERRNWLECKNKTNKREKKGKKSSDEPFILKSAVGH